MKRSQLLKLGFFSGLLLIWWALAESRLWPPYLFPSPADVLDSLKAGWTDRTFSIGIAASLQRIALGYALSAAIGIPLGLLIARLKWLDETLGALMVGLQTLPSICWLPAALLWFGLSDAAIIFVVVMGSVLSIALGTEDAVRDLPPIYVRAARTMGVEGVRLYWDVVWPAALPGTVAALKQGWAFAWRSLMAAELLFVSPGLGQLLQMGRDLNDIALVATVMMLIILIGWAVDTLIFSAVESRLRRRRGMTG